MGKWRIRFIDFDPEVEAALRDFIGKNPVYKRILDARLNDLLNFPELIWATAVFDQADSNEGEFVTKHQQMELAGKVYRRSRTVYITHFSFHR